MMRVFVRLVISFSRDNPTDLNNALLSSGQWWIVVQDEQPYLQGQLSTRNFALMGVCVYFI